MSDITSSTTYAQAKASALGNASYAEDASVAKCRAFMTALRALLLFPEEAGLDRSSTKHNHEVYAAQLREAQAWLEAHDTADTSTSGGPRVTRMSFNNFR